LRLLVPGFEGLYNVKWLRRIKVADQPYVAFQEVSRYTTKDPKSRWFQFEQGPKSVITFPSGEQRLPSRGFYMITGLAWSGGGAIRRVEVSIDGGRTWKDAQLQEPALRIAHARFSLPWNWNGEEAVLLSRCTDELGQVQPSLAEFAKFWGVTPAGLLADTGGVGHFNVIQPWKVAPDGSVHNALA
jgi:sulfane dehydrogenase subunit SoxC